MRGGALMPTPLALSPDRSIRRGAGIDPCVQEKVVYLSLCPASAKEWVGVSPSQAKYHEQPRSGAEVHIFLKHRLGDFWPQAPPLECLEVHCLSLSLYVYR